MASDRIAIGRVLKPWGREGAVVVEPFSRTAGRFADLHEVEVVTAGRTRTIKVRPPVRQDSQGRPLLCFEGVTSIDEAEAIRGAELVVPSAAAVRPEGESYFNHELLGSEVVTTEGARLGRVVDILETGGPSVLVVRDDAGHEVLVPAARPILHAVNPAAKRIVIEPPEGLLALNDPETKDGARSAEARVPGYDEASPSPARRGDSRAV